MESFFSGLTSIPPLRPTFNVGAGLDIPCGAYFVGENGESILSGGMPAIMSIQGPPNAFKSVVFQFVNMSVADRIEQFIASFYDAEGSMNYNRVNQLSKRFPNLRKIIHGDPTLPPDKIKFIITSSADELGDVYFDKINNYGKERIKNKIKKLDTPFVDKLGKYISIFAPIGVFFDSLSKMEFTTHVENILDKNSLGESGNNIYYMKQGLTKKILIDRLPHLNSNCGMYFTLTAQLGDEFIMDQYAPKKHDLTHSKRGSVTTGVTKGYKYINNIIYEIFSSDKFDNKPAKTGVQYPLIQSDRNEDCTDLMKLSIKVVRNKEGATGMPIEIIVSQREGVLPHLTNFHCIKEEDFGLSGNNTSYNLDLVPDVKLGRTTVRGIIDENPKIRRALEITHELLQIKSLWYELPDNLMCTPLELYNDLKAMGYNWDILLNTRGWWCFKESESKELPFLSTLDLLKMRKESILSNNVLYKPFWLNDDKLTYNKKFKHILNNG